MWNLSGRFTHLSFWNANLALTYMARALDDRSTRGGPLIERPENWRVNGSFRSDPRKPVTFGVGAGGGRDAYGGWSAGVGTAFGFKTSPRWSLTLMPSLNRSYTLAQYVGTLPDASATATYGARYLFAPLRRTTLAMETRLDFTFTPNLSVQLYAQPFISSGDFEETAELVRPQSYEFAKWDGEAPDLDFNLRSLRGTAVLRWQWRPGSTLYLAWQQTRADYAQGVGDFDFGRDGRALFSAQPDNIFMLKINYWLTP